jgi:hypothetical protein
MTADKTAKLKYLVSDVLSQAEHGTDSQVVAGKLTLQLRIFPGVVSIFFLRSEAGLRTQSSSKKTSTYQASKPSLSRSSQRCK